MKPISKKTLRRIRLLSAIALTTPMVQTVSAQTATYTATTASTTWSTGTNWTGGVAPTSSAAGTLIFTGPIAPSNNPTTTDNLGGVFLLNTMTLSGSNSGSFAAASSLTIAGSGGSTLEFAGANSTVNLNSNNGSSAPFTNTVSMASAIDGILTFTGNGSAAFTFSGILSNGATPGPGSIVKSGTSVLTLSGANTFSNGTTLSAGTLNINQGVSGTSSSSAVGTGNLTIAGGTINNTSGSNTITLGTNNTQTWSGDFAWSGTNALNMGTGAVSLTGNRIITASGANALTVGGGISGGASLTLAGSGTVILNGTNSYTGGTVINGGTLVFGTSAGIAGSGQNVTVASGATVGFGFAVDQTTLGRLTTTSAGAVALGVNSANNLDFSAGTGVGLPLSLGAVLGTTDTYSGTLTPFGTTYRLGGGGGTLIVGTALAGGGNSLVVGGKSSAGSSLTGAVTFATAGTYGGGTTINTGTSLQTNLTGTTTPFGSGGVILNTGTLGFGTATPALTSGQSMDASIGALTFNGAGTIQLAKGASTQPVPVKVTVASLNQGAQGGVLLLKPSAGANLGVTEQVVVTSGSGTVPLTVTNGMVAPNIIDITSNNFVTYGANGFADAPATTVYGANNIVTANANYTGTQNAYAYIWSGGAFTSTVNVSSGGFIVIGAGGNSSGTINFGTAPGYVYFTASANNNAMKFTGTNGITFSGGGLINNSATSIGLTGGITFTNGGYTFNSSEPYATMNPNALTVLNGSSWSAFTGTLSNTFSSLAGDGLLSSGNGITMNMSLNGLASNSTTFSGNITTTGTGAINITKNGVSTQTLTGINNFLGTTTVRNGAIVLSGAGTLGTGTITLTSGGTFTLDNGAANANRISGITTVNLGGNLNLIGNAASDTTQSTGALNLATGPGVITLTATGGTKSDQLIFSSLGTRAAGSTSLFRGTGLTGTFTGAAGTSNIAFTTGPTFAATGSFTSSGTGTGTQMAVIRGGLFDATATGGGSGFATVDATTKSVRLLDSTTEQTTTYGTAGTNALLNLTAATPITGAATNTLQVNNVSGTAWTLTNTGTLNPANGLLFTGTAGITLTGGTYTGANATDLVILSTNTAGVTIATAISNTTSGGSLTFGGSGNLTLNGAISSGAAAGTIYFDNSGTTTLGGTIATGTGGIQVLNGTVKVAGTGLAAFNKALTIAPNSTFDINNNAVSLDAVISSNSAANLTNNAGGGTVTNSGGTLTNLTVGAGGGGGTFNGLITSLVNVVKAGAGTEILTGASTYTGTTTITGGILSVTQLTNGGSASGIGQSSNAASNLIIGNGGTFKYEGAGDSTDRLFTMNGAGATLDASGYNTTGGLSGKVTYTGTGTVVFGTPSIAETLTLTGTNTQANSLAATLANNGASTLSVNKTSTGTWVLNGTSTYTGTTTISNGTLGVSFLANGGTASPIGQSSNVPASLLIGGGATNGTLQYTGTTNSSTDRLFTINGTAIGVTAFIDASGTGSVNFTNMGNLAYGTAGQSRGLTLTGTSTAANSFAPTIENNGAGVTTLTKTGAGSWTVSGANTFTGGTTLTTGTLVAGANSVVSGGAIVSSPLGLGTLAIGTGATFSDNGTAITLANSVTTTGSLTFGGAGSLTFDGTTLTVPSTFVLGSYTNMAVNNTTTIKNVVSGGFGLIQSGTGTLVLTGANTYTGSTTVAQGTLSVATLNSISGGSASSNLGVPTATSGSIALGTSAGGLTGTLRDTGTGETTDRGIALVGNGTIDQSGTGNLNFTGAVTGAVSNSSATKSLTLTGSTAGTGQMSGVIANTTATTTTGTVAATFSSGATTIFVANAAALFTPGMSITGTGISGGTTVVAVNGNQVTLSIVTNGTGATAGTVLNVTGGVTSLTSLTKSGSGTWVVSGANTFTGGVNLNGGTLGLGIAQTATTGPLGGGSGGLPTGIINFNGGTLQFSSVNTTDYSSKFSSAVGQAYNFDTNGTTTVSFGSTFGAGAGGFTFGLNDTAVTPGKLTLGNMIFNGPGAFTITRGELDLNNTNPSALPIWGSVVVNGSNATLKALRSSQFYTGDPTPTTVSVQNGLFDIGATNQTLDGVQITGGSITGSTGLLTSLSAFDVQAGTVSAILDGAVGLNKTGTGTATLSGANTFTGPVTISNGTLAVNALAAVGTAQPLGKNSTVTLNGATSVAPGVLQYTSNSAATLAQDVTVTTGGYGTISNTGSGLLTVAGALSKDGSVLNFSGGVAGGQIKVTGTISGASANSDLNATNNSHVILTANNSYTGPTGIDSTSSIQVGDNTTTGTLGNGAVTNNGVLSYKRTNAITESNAISGTGSLLQIGSGTTTLTAANTYSGGTTVSAGKLLVDNTTGSGTGSGAVSVASGATLGGTGAIGGSTTLASGSILAPGNTAGMLTVNSGLTLNNNTAGSLLFDLGSISDKVVVGGTLTLNNQDFTSFTFDTSGGGFGAGTYVLFDASSAIAGTLGSNLTSTQFTGYNATLSIDGLNNDLILTVAVVPEPGTWAMMVGGLVVLIVIHRRRNKMV